MNVLDAIHREMRTAAEQAREIVHVRITPAAVRGSCVALTIPPERARARSPLVIAVPELGTVAIGDPESERHLEVLVHPSDWTEALVSAGQQEATVTHCWGIPVVRT